MPRRNDFEPYEFRVPFGVVAFLVGCWFLYAVWAGYVTMPVIMNAGTDCVVTDSPGVHITPEWTLSIQDACGDYYRYHLLYFLGFNIVGVLLVHGGAKTVWEELG
jgi:hypothetical protein